MGRMMASSGKAEYMAAATAAPKLVTKIPGVYSKVKSYHLQSSEHTLEAEIICLTSSI